MIKQKQITKGVVVALERTEAIIIPLTDRTSRIQKITDRYLNGYPVKSEGKYSEPAVEGTWRTNDTVIGRVNTFSTQKGQVTLSISEKTLHPLVLCSAVLSCLLVATVPVCSSGSAVPVLTTPVACLLLRLRGRVTFLDPWWPLFPILHSIVVLSSH